MPRITNSDLEEIFDTDLSTESLDQWIEIASGIADDIADKDSSISSTRLEHIELMLSAHYASTQDPRLSSTSRETASAEYRKNDDYATDYMATAVGLDPTGTIAGLNKPNASLSVVDAKGID